MDLITVLLVPTVVLVTAGIFYLYSIILRLLAKTTVRNKVVLITDSLTALGNECAKLFHKGGARLILCGKSWEKLESLSEQLASESDPTLTFPPKLIQLDFTDMESVPEVTSEVLECYGCLDVVIFNSSMKVKAPVQSLSLEMDKIVMDANYFGPITLAKGVLPSMIARRTGHIVLINSIQGKIAVPFRTTYAASKHAVQAFFDSLRAEVQEYGISVSTVCHTFISGSSTDDEVTSKSIWATLTRQKPCGVPPEEMASELLNTLSSKKKEIVMARSISKAAIYARSLFPNLFFAVMAAGVKNAAAVERDNCVN
ncbi:dehydrogenase/reductase SDR family member 7C-B [Chanos chanos]|uniref:Dehydrogenase/reductase SDR family member 7C-B n=1 Tax=Chanos chanos TaxID=29144 RepID=A0A6J2WPN5_CHACN|nr:dehydrogenase/reductase SDR family member 7C-B-like [Chanos chanos]